MHRYDAFISFADRDNLPELVEKGRDPVFRVTRLREELERSLSRDRRSFRFYSRDLFDPRIASQEQTEAAIRASALFVPVFSEAYLKCDRALRELGCFLNSGCWEQADFDRIVGVELVRISRGARPDAALEEVLKRTDRVAFHENDRIWMPHEADYYQAIEDLAQAVRDRLPGVNLADAPTEKESVTFGRCASSGVPSICVYLAETTHDLRRVRDEIGRKLRQDACVRVLPDRHLRMDSYPDMASCIESQLGQSIVSLHLVGQYYGDTVNDGQREVSLSEVQFKAATARAESGKLNVLCWCREDLRRGGAAVVEESEQRAFLDSVADFRVDVTIEELVDHVREMLPRPAESAAGSRLSQQYVAIQCKPDERDALAEVERRIVSENLVCVLPPLGVGIQAEDCSDSVVRAAMERQDGARIRQVVEETIAGASGVLITFASRTMAEWSFNQYFNCLKLASRFRKAESPVIGFYCTEPLRGDRERKKKELDPGIRGRNVLTIYGADELDPFLNRVKSRSVAAHA